MTPREEQVKRIEKLEKMLSTCRKNQVKLMKDLERKLKQAKKELVMFDKYQLEAEELKASK